MKAGINRCIITPSFTGFELAGFGRPDRKCIGIHDDITLTTMVLQHETGKCIIICADLIGFDRKMVQQLKQEIKLNFGFNEHEVFFNASHTHSGPATLSNMSDSLGKMDDRFPPFLYNSVISSVKAALGSMEDVEMFVGKDTCEKIGINRRRIENGVCDFAPYPAGIRNDDVIVLKLVGKAGVKAVLFNYACHPSTIDTDYLSADYPGAARGLIEKEFGNEVPAMFVQGCCGDIRVQTIKDNYFRAGTFEDVAYFGKVLSDLVLGVCNGKMDKIEPELSGALIDMTLKTQKFVDKQHLQEVKKTGAPYQQEWAQQLLADYDNLKDELAYTIQKITIGDKLVIFGMDGEVCTPYSVYIKSLFRDKNVITAGYSNGNIGYIPSEEMFSQGGYEPDGSIMCYSLPSQFDTDIEKRIKEKLDMLKGV